MFSTTDCGPSNAIKAIFGTTDPYIASNFVKIDINDNEKFSKKCKLRGTPFQIYDSNKVVAKKMHDSAGIF